VLRDQWLNRSIVTRAHAPRQVQQLPTEEELVFILLDTDEVQLCLDSLAKLPSVRAAQGRLTSLRVSQ
jgi:hypothetical protein